MSLSTESAGQTLGHPMTGEIPSAQTPCFTEVCVGLFIPQG